MFLRENVPRTDQLVQYSDICNWIDAKVESLANLQLKLIQKLIGKDTFIDLHLYLPAPTLIDQQQRSDC